jgi:glycosyltransferase involved in cell wall biosynthesis
LNIFCIGPAFPLRGGIANFNTAVAKNFIDSGHRVSIISFSLQYPGFLFPGKTQYEEGPPPEGIPILSLINSLNPFSWMKAVRAIRSKSPDLIVVHHWMPFIAMSLGFIVRRLKRKPACPVIVIAHNVIPHEKQAGWKSMSKYLLSACDAFIVLSASLLDDLKIFTDSRHKDFIPHPVYDQFGEAVDRNEAAGRLGLDPSLRYLLFFGMIRKYKGLDLLIRAFAEMRNRVPDLRLIVAGEFYSGEKEYLDLIHESGAGDRIIIRDHFIPSGKVRDYFSLADLVTQPYRSATQSGVSQIAYHFGVPMLVTDVGGLAEIVPHMKVGYVTPVDEHAIAAAITDFFEKERALAFRLNILEERKRFTWEALTTRILELAGKINREGSL